jgi:zinc protease
MDWARRRGKTVKQEQACYNNNERSTMRRLIAALILQFSFALCSPAQLKLPYKTFQLANGLTVILHEDHSVPLVAVNIWYHVGSAREKPGRTGFAHLFEHMLFQGSEHVGDDQHFALIQEAGGTLNGSTNNDRTNYFETVPSQFLEMVLWLESDRMGFLLPAMTQTKLDNQRDVVKNERRQGVDNQPYGRAFERIHALLYEPGYPYYWPVIGSMEDLGAASLDDVKEFFRTYYIPNNASLVIAGDFDAPRTKGWVEKYFGGIPRDAPVNSLEVPPPALPGEKIDLMEDRVQLPRLYLAWHSPAIGTQTDAELDILADVLAGGKNSRLYKSLVYEKQAAQDVSAFQFSRRLSGMFMIQVTAKPGHTLPDMLRGVQEEIDRLKSEPPSVREVERAINGTKASFIYRLQSIGAKADQMNQYNVYWGDPGAFEKDLARYRSVTPADVQRVANEYLTPKRVVFSVVPLGKTELAVR